MNNLIKGKMSNCTASMGLVCFIQSFSTLEALRAVYLLVVLQQTYSNARCLKGVCRFSLGVLLLLYSLTSRQLSDSNLLLIRADAYTNCRQGNRQE